MTLSRSVTSLISDGQGNILRDFLQKTPEQWADEHMVRRYGAAPPRDDDSDDHFARLCYDFLVKEYKTLRGWFTDGKLSRMMMSRAVSNHVTGCIGNGIGWDFKRDGDPEPRMLQFKGTMISACRAAELKIQDPRVADCGSLEIGGLAKLVRAAYESRAMIHTWLTVEEGSGQNKRVVSSDTIAKRWVAFRTYNFLLRYNSDPDFAWGASRAQAVFGAIDNVANLGRDRQESE